MKRTRRQQALLLIASLLPVHDLSASNEFASLVPSLSDWHDFGWVLEAGPEGNWDHLLGGTLSASVIRSESIYLLYYGGACCYSDFLDSVTFRAIGVASSSDGIRFRKHPENPVVSWLPHNAREEGATSSAVAVAPGGGIVLYFGANTLETRTTVNADARLGLSTTGFSFEDGGLILDHQDSSIWGAGDEIFPITALEHEGTWIVYYLTNGVPGQRHLAVAWGPSPERLIRSSPVRADGELIPAWGIGGGVALVAPDTYVLFVNDMRIPRTEARFLSPSSPDRLSAPVEVYQWEDAQQVTVLLDDRVDTWFLYYRDPAAERYGVKLAAAGPTDDSPPSVPGEIRVSETGEGILRLDWNEAVDRETGVGRYLVYRNDLPIGKTAYPYFLDAHRPENAISFYRISAVNFHGVESPRSEPLEVPPGKP